MISFFSWDVSLVRVAVEEEEENLKQMALCALTNEIPWIGTSGSTIREYYRAE